MSERQAVMIMPSSVNICKCFINFVKRSVNVLGILSKYCRYSLMFYRSVCKSDERPGLWWLRECHAFLWLWYFVFFHRVCLFFSEKLSLSLSLICKTKTLDTLKPCSGGAPTAVAGGPNEGQCTISRNVANLAPRFSCFASFVDALCAIHNWWKFVDCFIFLIPRYVNYIQLPRCALHSTGVEAAKTGSWKTQRGKLIRLCGLCAPCICRMRSEWTGKSLGNVRKSEKMNRKQNEKTSTIFIKANTAEWDSPTRKQYTALELKALPLPKITVKVGAACQTKDTKSRQIAMNMVSLCLKYPVHQENSLTGFEHVSRKKRPSKFDWLRRCLWGHPNSSETMYIRIYKVCEILILA